MKLRLPFTLRFGDQATSASGSTYVSSSPPPQSTTIGVPREVSATQPVPEILTFHRPCPANLARPLTRSTPQVRWASKASRLVPLTESASPLRLMHDDVGAVVGEVEQAVAGALHQRARPRR